MSQQYLVIDNGSYCIKTGFRDAGRPTKVQNVLSKTRDGHIYIGNDYLTQTNNYSRMVMRRPFDQGHLVSWETEKPVWDYCMDKVSADKEIDFGSTHLTLTETPFQLPQLSMNTDQIVFEEYGFNEYYRCSAASLVPWASTPKSDFTLVIDAGFSSTWIMPILYQKVYWKGVKKLPIGGKLLNGLLRELISFRYYDMSDEPLLINTIKEKTCFVAEDFKKCLKEKDKLACDFVLPDFKTTATGFVRTKDTKIHPDTQLLPLSDVRCTVPESLYHPEIIFGNLNSNDSVILSTSLKGITELVVECIMSCPEVARPLLSANIVLVGGTSQLPNFRERLQFELRKELPQSWSVEIKEPASEKDEVSWDGGTKLAHDPIINDISISRKEYFEHGSNWCQKQFGFRNL